MGEHHRTPPGSASSRNNAMGEHVDVSRLDGISLGYIFKCRPFRSLSFGVAGIAVRVGDQNFPSLDQFLGNGIVATRDCPNIIHSGWNRRLFLLGLVPTGTRPDANN